MLGLTSNTSLETLVRGFNQDGYHDGIRSTKAKSGFDAVADYDTSTSSLFAHIFSAFTCELSLIVFDWFHSSQTEDKKADFAFVIAEILVKQRCSQKIIIDNRFVIEEKEDGVWVSRLDNQDTPIRLKAPTLHELRKQLTEDIIAEAKISSDPNIQRIHTHITSPLIQNFLKSCPPCISIEAKEFYLSLISSQNDANLSYLNDSVAFQIITLMQAEIVSLTPAGTDYLSYVMNQEAKFLKSHHNPSLADFYKRIDIVSSMSEVVQFRDMPSAKTSDNQYYWSSYTNIRREFLPTKDTSTYMTEQLHTPLAGAANDDELGIQTTTDVTKNESLTNLIFRVLSPKAQKVFTPLFDIEEVGTVNAKSPVVSGDPDGSIARLVLLGIQAGIISLNRIGVNCLVNLLEAEAITLEKINSNNSNSSLEASFTAFQKSKHIQDAIAKLTRHMRFKTGHTRFLSIGDFMRDRLSANQDAGRLICEQMKKNGAIFITGNHDVLAVQGNDNYEFGNYGLNTASIIEWVIHQDKVLSNAYFDDEANTLYIHNGIEEDDSGNIKTAFGLYITPTTGFKLKEFLTWVNAPERRPKPIQFANKEKEYQENLIAHSRLTNFRPEEDDIEKIATKHGIRIVHGHNGKKDTSRHRVVALNARGDYRKNCAYMPVAARIGMIANE